MSTQQEQYTVRDWSRQQENTVGPIDRDLTALDNALMVCSILEEQGYEADYEPAGDSDS